MVCTYLCPPFLSILRSYVLTLDCKCLNISNQIGLQGRVFYQLAYDWVGESARIQTLAQTLSPFPIELYLGTIFRSNVSQSVSQMDESG